MKLHAFIDKAALERLLVGDSRSIDAFLLPEIRKLKTTYERVGDPYVIYLAANSVSSEIEKLPSARNSFQYSRLQALLAQMLLNQGKNIQTLSRALDHIHEAIEVILSVNAITEDIIKAHVTYALYLGVIQKALGKYDTSIKGMRETSNILIQKKGATELDLIMLRRQEIIMLQNAEGHKRLADSAPKYAKIKPVEYYSTIKRLFEFTMNNGRHKEARELFPEFKRAFAVVSKRLPPLSHISFLKNISQFLSLEGQTKKATTILLQILHQARQRNLTGQERQIIRLLNEIDQGGKGELVTFTVS